MVEKIYDFLNELDKAMVNRDIQTLDKMLEENACLKHITGYVQPKKEWLPLVKKDYFTYRKITSKNVEITKLNENIYLAVYDWTIQGNSIWNFKNELKLKYENDTLKWIETNEVYFR